MSLEENFPEIVKLVEEHLDRIRSLPVLIITHNQWLRVYNGRIERYQSHEELNFIRGLHPYRGEILNFFAKLEFIINGFIQARFLGLFSERAYEFDDLLGRIDFEQRIRLLKKWGLINNNLLSKTQDLFKVRNELAHRWDEKEAFYGKDPSGDKLRLSENFDKFKADAEFIWVEIIGKFITEEEKHVGSLIQ